MQKAEKQKDQAQNQTAARQGGRAAVASPQSKQIAQLRALAESSPQMEKQGQLAAQIHASPAMSAQRKFVDGIANSPNMAAQRKFGEGVNVSPHLVAQCKKLHSLSGGAMQLKGAEDEMLQGKFGTVQRVEEEEPLQGKFETAQRVEEEELLQGKFATNAAAQLKEGAPKPNDTGLPDNLKSGVESLSGISMDSVKVHYNSSQPAQISALAYAQGNDIHVAPGQEQHLPHEAWHVVQQAQGRVRPTVQMKGGVPVNDDQGLEHEADVMGVRALGQGTAANANLKSATASSNAAQLWPWSKKPEASSKPEEIEMQSLSTPKKGEESHEEDQASATKDGLKIKEDLPPEQKKTLAEKGDLVVGTVGEAATTSSGIADAVKTVEAPEAGLGLKDKADGVLTKITNGFSNVAKVFTAFVSPIIEAGMHFLGMKEKWGQWSTYDAAAKKEDAPQEAVYAKDKTKKGFLRHLGLFFQNISDFIANLLLVIPGANVIAAGWKLFNLIAGVIKSVVGAAKGIWQFFKGEKKDVHSASLLEKALKDDDVSLKLIFDLKLPSIAGSGYALIDTVLGKISEMSESAKAKVMEKFGMDAVAGQRIIDINKKKAPTTIGELSALLKLACKNSSSKELILKELKETMTGFGK